ncbi:uncharacterized protein E0L32_004175 [Thyridium curvatum]|uniref:alpha-L-rhamnosidase n=1 Tax=Thyridium curvatum TaxID=1093900 RepID=A0A507BHY3_9PEZI|nr:uncharacterized protein E0L32_004175 [Thyridium curvatum]TPX16180.1 hypothetical protein E0L32_004175 [Thyridium curvatum]
MAAPRLAIARLRFEHHQTGLGVPVPAPRLSWNVVAKGDEIPANWKQESYEIQIKRAGAAEPKTFTAATDSTVLVPWPDAPLRSAEAAQVRVRSLGKADAGESNSEWSDWAAVEAALLDKSDWVAKAITAPERTDAPHPDENGTRPWRFRKTFEVAPGRKKKGARSRLYITALGVYEAYLNGERVGDECLAPGWTAFQHRIQFQVFDVGPLLVDGANTLAIEVAEGFYVGRLLWGDGVSGIYGKRLGAMAQLSILDDEADAEPSVVVQTDESWSCAISPIVASGIYDGETYDMDQEYDFTSSAASSSGAWKPVEVLETPKIEFVAASCPPVRVTETVKPVSITKDPDGKTLVDFGQNLVGRLRIPSLSRPDGHRVVLRFAEVLENERLGTRPLRCAKATDRIIFGGGKELKDWYGHFTYHGFRYMEVTGWGADDADQPLTTDSVVAEVMHTDMLRTGHFSCSDAKVNQLHQNVVWSMRGNFVGIPTDCPQRDERLGWTGDIQVFAPTASFLYDCGGMLANWMRDVVLETAEQGGVVPLVVPNALKASKHPVKPQAVWDDVVVLAPWTLYRHFGDAEVLRSAWAAMKLYLRAIPRGADALWTPDLWQLGDWLDPNAPPAEPGNARTDGALVADEYLVHVTGVMAEIAGVLGLAAEREGFRAEHEALRRAFHDKYVASSGLVVGDSQTSLALALVFGLLRETGGQRRRAAERLVRLVRLARFRVSTGFAGTPAVLHALSGAGFDQVAYRMLLEEGCPSWLYPVGRGATTIWERWDSMLPDGRINPGEMTSFNHYALGSVAEWLHRNVGGLAPLEPGWKRFRVRPVPGGTLTGARASFVSPQGEIRTEWELAGDGVVKVGLTVPPNATAVVEKPDGAVEVGSGVHSFEWKVTHEQAWPPKAISQDI